MSPLQLLTHRRIIPYFAMLVLSGLLTATPLHAHTWSLPLDFTPPAPGTYTLPVIKPATDGEVMDTTGRPRRLFDYMEGKIVLISFIYTRCSDARGCPLATAVLHAVEEALRQDAALAPHVRLLSLSFDPEHDTPEVMRRYATAHATPLERNQQATFWHRLTASSPHALQPMLDGYGQYVLPILDAHGGFTGTYSHLLKVFLIDPHQRVRNIYSVDFLHPEVLINDLKTLLLAEDMQASK